MDRTDRDLLKALLADGRASYQELGRRVHLSPNTVAERVKRLRRSGVLTGFHAALDVAALGRPMTLLSDVRLSQGTARADFERRLAAVPQVVSAAHVTGDYDYELRIVCADAAEVEDVLGALKDAHGVREFRSRLLLSEVSFGPAKLLD